MEPNFCTLSRYLQESSGLNIYCKKRWLGNFVACMVESLQKRSKPKKAHYIVLRRIGISLFAPNELGGGGADRSDRHGAHALGSR